MKRVLKKSERPDLVGFSTKRGRGRPLTPRDRLSETVNSFTLGELLGLSTRMIGEYLSRGDGTIVRDGTGRYLLRESVKGYIKLLRSRPDTRALTQEKIRQTKENADNLTLKNQKLKGELVAAPQVEMEWATILRDLRSSLLALPARLQQQAPALTVRDVAIIDREIRDLLTRLGNDAA